MCSSDLGSAFFGHFGDRVGRKTTLVAALLTMGASTVGIGLLPTYASIGIAAPVLLALCRFGQGLGLGGEWGGAVLLAIENAPPGRRAWYGMFPQLGAPVGFFFSGSVFLVLSSVLSNEQFFAYGWRIPFLASALLVIVGLYVRLTITETPVFQQALQSEDRVSVPMFAVLFGGCTALLPVFAKDILDSGPSGYGWLRAAPGIGALLMSFTLASRPPMRRTGPALFGSVAVFALATIGFGLSRSLPLSWFLLLVTGAFDMISVIIRHTLMQLWTPDAMRGRVSAINGMFISVSNELGSAESGYVAHLFDRPGDPAFGPTISTVSGGIGSLIVIATIAWLYPEVRRHGRLDQGPDELAHPPSEADANPASHPPTGKPA